MKPLIVAEQLRRSVPGGVGTYTQGLLRGLATIDGIEPTVFASRAPQPDPLGEFGFPVVTSRWPSRALTRLWDRGQAAPDVEAFDIVHATSMAAPRTRNLVVTIHDLAWRDAPETFPRRGRNWHEHALLTALEHARALVAPSRDVAARLLAVGADPSSVHVIEEGSDHLPAPDEVATKTLLNEIGVDGPYLLCVGTLEPRKNLRRLFDAYQLARPQLPEPWPLVVVGPPGWGDDVSPPEGVRLAGRAEPAVLAGLYRQARALAYVSLLEGFGLPAVEAMASGIPVVSSAIPSVGDAALIVDPLDVGDIARALVTAASDEEERVALIERGHRRAEVLTWAKCAQQHVDLWATLL